MNYSSVEEILSGISNMTAIRDGTKNDDGNDTLAGADWLSFNGNTVNNIIVSGNSWLGFGSNTEHLRVNRRDSAVYYVRREEGTVHNFYKFIRIRWEGYSTYNNMSVPYGLNYEVILWDTGDISLHLVTQPTTYNDGTYQLVADKSYAYTINSANPDVTFYYSPETRTYQVANEMINLLPPFDRKYLVRSDDIYYTIQDGGLQQLNDAVLDANLFQTYGFDESPAWDDISGLVDPEVLYWYDSADQQPSLSADMVAMPLFQSLITNKIDLTHETILGIERATATCEGELMMAVSFDDKQTWKAWSGDSWITVSDEFSGMSKSSLESITVDQWNELFSGADGFYIRLSFVDVNQSVSNVYIDFAN